MTYEFKSNYTWKTCVTLDCDVDLAVWPKIYGIQISKETCSFVAFLLLFTDIQL